MQSLLGDYRRYLESWWLTVDRLVLVAIAGVMVFGVMMVASSSPIIAERIGFGGFYFLKRHLVFLVLSVFLIIGISFLSPRMIKRLGILGYIAGIGALIFVLAFGQDINGAKRWLSLGGISLQPSEFMKPVFIIVTAWLLSEAKARDTLLGFKCSVVTYCVLIGFLVMQPDLGMSIVISTVWAGQWFLAGINVFLVAILGVLALIGLLLAYLFLPHVTLRVNSFLSASPKSNYQVQKSLESFNSGGVMGRGPGEGVVKQHLPDCHTDFVFAVIGEELGAMMCLVVICLYGFIFCRGIIRLLNIRDLFVLYAVAGLLMQVTIQAMINMGVALHLLPTKGMTLPFISYGGSSMLAIAITIGMLLALTKRRYGALPTMRKINQ